VTRHKVYSINTHILHNGVNKNKQNKTFHKGIGASRITELQTLFTIEVAMDPPMDLPYSKHIQPYRLK